MKLAIVFGLLVSTVASAQVVSSPVAYSDAADLSTSTTQIKMTGARYFEVATKTSTTKIPGCNEWGENYTPGDCDRVVVLEREPVIQVDVEYVDPSFRSEGHDKMHLNFNLPVAAFNAEEVAALKAKRGLFGVQLYSAAFAKKNLELSVSKATRVIQVVDVRNSKICQVMESGEVVPGCVEVINYKPANTTVKALKINIK
jgi:hypothetical protein